MNMNIVEETRKRIAELIKMKEDDTEKINAAAAAEAEKLEQAEKDAADAAESLDMDAFADANERKDLAALALDMYRKRLEQLNRNKYVTEAESDSVIKSLLAYEDELSEAFRRDALEIINALEEKHDAYKAAVYDIENTITRWTSNIHANYQSYNGSTYIDPATGERTSRSDRPQPVHHAAYVGCRESEDICSFLRMYKKHGF